MDVYVHIHTHAHVCNVYTQKDLISVHTLHFCRRVSVRTRSTNTPFNSKSLLVHYNCCNAPKCRALILTTQLHIWLCRKFNMKMKFNKRQQVSGLAEAAPRSSPKSSRGRNDLAAGNFIMRMDEWRFAAPAATVLSRARTWPTTSVSFSWWFTGRKWHSVKKAEAFLSLAGSKRQKQMEFLGRPVLELRSLLFLFIEELLLLLLLPRWHIYPMERKNGANSRKKKLVFAKGSAANGNEN